MDLLEGDNYENKKIKCGKYLKTERLFYEKLLKYYKWSFKGNLNNVYDCTKCTKLP